MIRTLTDSQQALLRYLATRRGVVPVKPEERENLNALHDLGYAAIHNEFALITDKGQEEVRNNFQ